MNNEYLKPSEIARMLNVHSRTVINMIHDKRLRAITITGKTRKSYRILKGELDRFVAEEYEKYHNGEDDDQI